MRVAVGYVASNDMIISVGLRRLWLGIVIYFKAICNLLCGHTEVNHGKYDN
jgi:hypothetical protein